MPKLLTKSKYLAGLQCAKLLWAQVNDKSLLPKIDSETQHLFDEGHLVGEYAKKLFPDGIDVPSDDFMGNIRLTSELMSKRVPLFEAGILKGRLYSRIDILFPAPNNQWDIIEVKSSTSVKDPNWDDVSFQKHCCELAGLKIRKCFLMHINNEYVRRGDIEPEKLMIQEDITDKVNSITEGIEKRIRDMLSIIDSEEIPDVDIGAHCNKPYACGMDCWKIIPEGSVFDLYRGGKKSFDLYEQGILKIEDIPLGTDLTDKQEIQKETSISKKAHIHKESIKHFLKTIHPPECYLDFETVSFAVPQFKGTRPYQQIPFQFSLHIRNKEITHKEFLADGNEDPREKFITTLKSALPDDGSVIVYNESFEKRILTELADAFPDYAGWIHNNVIPRIVDLIIPFRNFNYYSPSQNGSASIKKVLPALVGKDYSNLEINQGGLASLAFLRLMKRIPEEERQKIRNDLLKYCGLDTEAMVWIVDKLEELIS